MEKNKERSTLTDVHAATIFREHFSTLADAIAQPDLPNKLASKLYSRSLVSRALRDTVHYTRGITLSDKALMILKAIEAGIQLEPLQLNHFLDVLRTVEPTLNPLVKTIRHRLSK